MARKKHTPHIYPETGQAWAAGSAFDLEGYVPQIDWSDLSTSKAKSREMSTARALKLHIGIRSIGVTGTIPGLGQPIEVRQAEKAKTARIKSVGRAG